MGDSLTLPIYYYKLVDNNHKDFNSVISHTKLKKYLTNPDSLNLQIIYGWGRDIGLKHSEVGFWIADTLLKLAIENNDHRAVISAYSLKGQMYQLQADIYNSIKYYKEAIRYGEENLDYDLHPNFDKLGINYVYLGDLYFEIDDLKNAKLFYQKGWNILKIINDEMIKERNSIEKDYEREYTTYHWDKLYSMLRLGMIYVEDKSNIEKGIEILKEVLITDNNYDGLLKFNANFYLGKAYLSIDSNVANKYLDLAYYLTKVGKMFDLQSKIGFFILELKSNYKIINGMKSLIIDTTLSKEILKALDYTNNIKIKYKFFKILSDYYASDLKLSKNYLDSSYKYLNKYYDEENLKEIGKIQSDIEYQSDVDNAKLESEISKQRFYYVLFIAIIILILMVILVRIYLQRRKLQVDLEDKNEKISEQNNKLADLIESRDKLLGILGHDLRNPIKGFRLSMKSIIERNKDKEINDSLVELEEKSIEVEKLLNSILDYSESNLNVTLNKDEDVDLEEIITQSLSLNEYFIKNKNLEIIKDIKIRDIKSNKFIINNILFNTISNAVKFSYENKPIIISTYEEDSFPIIKIQDSGIGIDEENLGKIRNQIIPKVQEGIKSPKGNGFGLITAISQLDKIDGNIFIDSQKGQGTTILIYIN